MNRHNLSENHKASETAMQSPNMARGYAVLQKKLEELESQLNRVISFPSETACHQLLAYDIRQRFSFFNNLLSAEKTVLHPTKLPHHLHRIAQRLTQLEAAFRAWDEYRTAAADRVETGSRYSCNDSCLNDDARDDCSNPEGFMEGEGEEKEAAVAAADGEARRDVRREEGKRVLIGGGRVVLVVGVALLSLVILAFPNVDYSNEFVLTPT